MSNLAGSKNLYCICEMRPTDNRNLQIVGDVFLITSRGPVPNAAWRQIQRKKFKTEAVKADANIKSDVVWTANSYLGKRVANLVHWNRFTFDPGG